MSDQLDRLIKAAESPGVVIQVLLYCAHDHQGAEGMLYIYDRAGRRRSRTRSASEASGSSRTSRR